MLRLTRILPLVAVLAVSVIAVPSALAHPGSVPPVATHGTTHPSERVQDLRHLRAGADVHITSESASAARKPAHSVSSDNGAPWTAIVLGLAGVCLFVAVLALAPRGRPRVAA